MLIKPTLNQIETFDATKDYNITFSANFGDQVVANEVEICKLSDNTLIYTKKVSTFQLLQILPSNTLINGITYKIHLRTYNASNQYSEWSDWVIVNCFSMPIIDISNVINNGEVNNQTFLFLGSYIQSEKDLLKCYKFILSDSNNIEIYNSGLLFDNLLQCQFTGLENNKKYNITLQVTTQNNAYATITKSFTANYIPPSFSNLVTLINNPNEASINLSIQAIRILGHTNGTVSIENNDWINVLNGIVYFDNNNGFQIPSGDWTYQWWGKNLIDAKTLIKSVLEGTLITKLYGQNNVTFKLEYYDGAFHLYKFIGDFLFSHYISNVINANVDNIVYLFCQSINGRISLRCEIIS